MVEGRPVVTIDEGSDDGDSEDDEGGQGQGMVAGASVGADDFEALLDAVEDAA